MMKLALVLLPILNAASADSATCTGNTKAVEGFPKKCYSYNYFATEQNFDSQNKGCTNAKLGNISGRLFTPESRNEMRSVEKSIMDLSKINTAEGNYIVSYVLYNFERFAGPSFGKHGYISNSPPYVLLNATSPMWGNGKPIGLVAKNPVQEPNGAQNCLSHHDHCQPVVVAARYPNGGVGFADVSIGVGVHSQICEFLIEN